MTFIFYLNIKQSKLKNCFLLGDRGYLSYCLKLNHFETVRLDLQTTKHENESNYKPYPLVLEKNERL
jgi:hypothetical protein